MPTRIHPLLIGCTILVYVFLLGPLIINAEEQNGWQVILNDDTLSTRHPLFPASVSREEGVRAI